MMILTNDGKHLVKGSKSFRIIVKRGAYRVGRWVDILLIRWLETTRWRNSTHGQRRGGSAGSTEPI